MIATPSNSSYYEINFLKSLKFFNQNHNWVDNSYFYVNRVNPHQNHILSYSWLSYTEFEDGCEIEVQWLGHVMWWWLWVCWLNFYVLWMWLVIFIIKPLIRWTQSYFGCCPIFWKCIKGDDLFGIFYKFIELFIFYFK